MSYQSLEEKIQAIGNPVDMLRNSPTGPYVYPVVPPEYSNWRDEQHAWQHTCVLYNQSYHMTDMYIEGPDALRLLTSLGINSMNNFGTDKAKQYVVCNPDGYVIGDVVLFNLGNERYNIVGRPSTHNWVRFNAEKGGYDVRFELDERVAARDGEIRRKAYRFQLQGPNALKTMEKATGGKVPDLKFFNTTTLTIAGRQVSALRHGMAGQPGFELYGP